MNKKIFLKLHLTFLLSFLYCGIAQGEDFTVGNLKYQISWDKTSVSVSKADNVSLSGELVIPEMVHYEDVTYTVTSIGYSGFSYTDISSVKLPKTITDINSYSFYHCTKLETINLPTHIQYIGYGSLSGCSSLKHIESHLFFPIDITSDYSPFDETVFLNTKLCVPTGSINRYKNSSVWKDFSTIVEIDMNDVDKEILKYTILDDYNVSVEANNKQIEGEIVIPGETVIEGRTYSVSQIKSYGFENCAKISSISLPSTIKEIGWWAFAHTNITNIDLPDALEDIGSWAFYSCSKLEKITIPKNVSSFGWGVFSGNCNNLKDIHVAEGNNKLTAHDGILLSKDETIMAAYAFGRSEEHLAIPETVTSLNRCSLFEGNNRLKSIKVPSGVRRIGGETFRDCSSLTNVELPDEIKEIDYSAFYNCSALETIVIPAQLSQISNHAYHGCLSVKSVMVRQINPMDISEDVFEEEIYSNATLYVPKGRIKYYRNSSMWNKFSTIEEIDMAGIEISNDPFDNVEDDQMILGYYRTSEYEEQYGYGGRETGIYKAAVHFESSRMNAFKSNNIKALRFALVETENISDFKIWIGKDRETPLFTQSVESVQKGWNTIKLTEPYQIDGDELYVGYEYNANQAYVYPISIIDGNKDDNSNYIYGKYNGEYKWIDESYEGNISIQCLVEGDIPLYNVAVKYVSFNQKYYKEGSRLNGNIILESQGKYIPDNYSLFIQIDTSEPIQITDLPNLGGGEQRAYFISSLEDIEPGKHMFKAFIKEVNGSLSMHDADDNTLAYFDYYKKCYTRNKVLIDYQTAQWCPSTPYFKLAFEKLAEIRDDYSLMSIHSSDDFSIEGGSEYTQFYDYLPSLWFDRYATKKASYFSYLIDPAGGTDATYLANRMDNNLNALKKIPSFATLDVSAEFVNGKITINVCGEREPENATIVDGANVTIVLTEDGLIGGQSDRSQNTYVEDYVHNNVLRKIVTNTWGDPITWNNHHFDMTFTIDADPNFKIENMHVIAFISRPYNGTNIEEINVINTNECDIKFPEQLIVKAYHGYLGDIPINERFDAKGVTADGVSQLVIYSEDENSDIKDATITLSTEFGEKKIEDAAYTGEVSNIHLLDNGKWGFIYTAPYIFPEACNTSKITLHINIKKNNGESLSKDIVIMRPAVILFHGFWGKPDTYDIIKKDLKLHLYEDKQIKVVSYVKSNADSFDNNIYKYNIVGQNAKEVYEDLRSDSIVSGQFDFVGYSMGGNLIRKHAQEKSEEGGINRIITIDTPHSGSQIANLIKKNIVPTLRTTNKIASSAAPFIPNPLLSKSVSIASIIADILIDNLDNPALDDLMPASDAISLLNGTNRINARGIPVHAICSYMLPGEVPVINTYDAYKSMPLYCSAYETNDFFTSTEQQHPIDKSLLDLLYEEENHDGVVSKTSQEGGLSRKFVTYQTDTYNGFGGRESNAHHEKAPKWYLTSYNLLNLLRKPKTADCFSTEGFNPVDLSHKTESRALNRVLVDSPNYTSLPDSTYFQISLAKESNDSIIDIKIRRSGNIVNNMVFTLIDKNQIIMSSGKSDYRFLIPDTCKGKIVIYALGRTEDGMIVGDTAFLHYKSDVELERISFTASDDIKMKSSESIQLDVVGTWNNGEETHIIPVFTTDNNDVINISNDTITALSEGECSLYATYYGLSDVRKVIVEESAGIISAQCNYLDIKYINKELIINTNTNNTKEISVEIFATDGTLFKKELIVSTNTIAIFELKDLPSSIYIARIKFGKEIINYKFNSK